MVLLFLLMVIQLEVLVVEHFVRLVRRRKKNVLARPRPRPLNYQQDYI